jgi:hypothetical protein
VLDVSAKTGQGMDRWIGYLRERFQQKRAARNKQFEDADRCDSAAVR